MEEKKNLGATTHSVKNSGSLPRAVTSVLAFGELCLILKAGCKRLMSY